MKIYIFLFFLLIILYFKKNNQEKIDTLIKLNSFGKKDVEMFLDSYQIYSRTDMVNTLQDFKDGTDHFISLFLVFFSCPELGVEHFCCDVVRRNGDGLLKMLLGFTHVTAGKARCLGKIDAKVTVGRSIKVGWVELKDAFHNAIDSAFEFENG